VGSDRTSLEKDPCLTRFVTYYGRKAFRRPLSAAEIDDFKAFYHQVVTAGSDGLAALVGRLLAHPNFYYRFDSDGVTVSGTDGKDAVYRLSKWELLSKMTFLFWASPPTDALYDRVANVDITTDENLKPLLDDILADPRAEQGILNFYGEWLHLDKTLLPGTDGNVLADQSVLVSAGLDSLPPTHRDDMIKEVLDLSAHYSLRTEGRLDDILTSPYSFAKTPALAKIYGVPVWDGTKEHLVSFPPGQRSGLLTRAAMVASNSEYTRPIIKGVRIRSRLLCGMTPPPPPGLNIKPLEHTADKTTRQAVEAVTADATCSSCHKSFNALGFLTENYDPLGRFRGTETIFQDMTAKVVSQLPVDTKAAANLDVGDSKVLADGVELGAHLAESGKAHACMARNYFEFVTGRQPDDKADACNFESLQQKLSAKGGSIKSMLRESVLQTAFRQRRAN
jgi:hypothetical protein